MLLPHSFLKNLNARNNQKENSISSPLVFTKLESLKHTKLKEIVVNSLYSKPILFQKEKLFKNNLLDINNISGFKQVMPKFLMELGEQALLMLEKRDILGFNSEINLKEQSLRLQTVNGEYLCDLTFVFFEDKEIFHVYLSANNKEVEENCESKVFISRPYRERFKGSMFTNEAKIKSFRLLPLILNNYNFETKTLNKFEVSGISIDHDWFKDMVVGSLLKLLQKPTLLLGEFKLAEAKSVYEKIFSICTNANIKNKKAISLGLVLEELSKHFNLNRNTVNLFELCYLLGTSKTTYDSKLTQKITFIDKTVVNHEEQIKKLLVDNEKLKELEKSLIYINDSYKLRDSVKVKIEENLSLINSLSVKEEEKQGSEVDFESIISSLENKAKSKDEQDYGFLNLLFVLRMMNIVQFQN